MNQCSKQRTVRENSRILLNSWRILLDSLLYQIILKLGCAEFYSWPKLWTLSPVLGAAPRRLFLCCRVLAAPEGDSCHRGVSLT